MRNFIEKYITPCSERLDKAVTERLPKSAQLSPPDEKQSKKLMWKCNLYWFLLWSILPLLALHNDFIDILENIVWGSHFQFGYDKNPYLGAWVGFLGYKITGGLWINYVLSQVFVITGFWATWKLAQRIMSPAKAFLSVIFLWGITFYGMKATELCDDVMELGFWPLVIYFFYRALRDQRKFLPWILTGIFAGCAFMVKYYGLVLLASMFFVLIFTKEGRKALLRPGIYLAGLIALLISLPNLIWLYENQMVAVDYAMKRAGLNPESFNWFSLKYVFRAIERISGVLLVPLVIYLLLLFRREKETPQDEPENARDSFNKTFLHIMMWGPFALTLLYSFVTGGKINYSWLLPCFTLLGVYCIYFYRPRLDRFSVRAVVSAMLIVSIVFGTIFLIRSAYHQPYRKKGCDYENFPGRDISAAVTEEWRKISDAPLSYVIGERQEACNVAVYSPDQPEAFFSANPAFSQWIDESDIRKKGAVIVWEVHETWEPDWLRPTLEAYPTTEIVTGEFYRAAPAWIKKLLGNPKTYQTRYCFILPAAESEE